MTELYLLRHGQTAWNKGLIFRGRHDIPLDDHGLAQARCAAQALAEIPVTRICTSPLSRAVQTAEPLAQIKGVALHHRPELLDIDYGQWTGKSQDEVERLFPELSRLWLESPERVRFPDGENLADVTRRSFSCLLDLARAAAEQGIVVVSHRVVLKVLICAALDIPLSKFWQIRLDTAGLSVLTFQGGTFTLRCLNDTCHLGGLSRATDAADF